MASNEITLDDIVNLINNLEANMNTKIDEKINNLEENMATKTNITTLEANMNTKINNLETELKKYTKSKIKDIKKDLEKTQTDLNKKIDTLEINMATKDNIKDIKKDLEKDIKNLNHDINVIKYKSEYNNVNMTPSTFDEALSSAAIFGRTRPVNSIYEE